MIQTFAIVVKDLFKSNSFLAQVGNFGFIILGVELDMELTLIAIGVAFGGWGLIIQWRSSILQRKVNKKELEVHQKELEVLDMQTQINKEKHPELFKNDTSRKKRV